MAIPPRPRMRSFEPGLHAAGSTPCNAIVYGSGYIPLGRMIRWGFALDLAGMAVIVLIVRLLSPLLR